MICSYNRTQLNAHKYWLKWKKHTTANSKWAHSRWEHCSAVCPCYIKPVTHHLCPEEKWRWVHCYAPWPEQTYGFLSFYSAVFMSNLKDFPPVLLSPSPQNHEDQTKKHVAIHHQDLKRHLSSIDFTGVRSTSSWFVEKCWNDMRGCGAEYSLLVHINWLWEAGSSGTVSSEKVDEDRKLDGSHLAQRKVHITVWETARRNAALLMSCLHTSAALRHVNINYKTTLSFPPARINVGFYLI